MVSALTEIDYVGRISNEAELSLFIIPNIVFFNYSYLNHL